MLLPSALPAFAFFHSVPLTENVVLHLLARLLHIRQSVQEQNPLKQLVCWDPAAILLSHYACLTPHISKGEYYPPLPCVLQHNGSGYQNLQANQVES